MPVFPLRFELFDTVGAPCALEAASELWELQLDDEMMSVIKPKELVCVCLVLDLTQLPCKGLQRTPQVRGNSLVPLFIYLLSPHPSPATLPTTPNPPYPQGQRGRGDKIP